MRSLLGLGFLFSTTALAVPGQFTHQGRLVDSDDVPLDGEIDVTFRVADLEEGGAAIWSETMTLSITNGYYAAVLGADEEANPLDVEILELSPLWLEIQISGSPPLYPRLPIQSVPYATMAEVAGEVAGGPVDATEVSIGGSLVINEAGEWVGASDTMDDDDVLAIIDGSTVYLGAGSTIGGKTPRFDDELVPWSELDGVPDDLLDGDNDSLAGLICADDQVLRFSGPTGFWECGEDANTQLSEAEVETYVRNAAIDLAAGSTVGGAEISTGAHTASVSWDAVTDMPADFADGIDDGLDWSEVESSLVETAVDLHPDTTIGGEPFASVTGGDTQTTGSVVLGNLEVATLSPASDIPQFTHTAWLMGSLGWEPLPYRSALSNLGDGSDGAFVPSDTTMSMAGGVYNYTEFELPEGYTINVTGSDPLVIRSQTTLQVTGTIKANGASASGYRGADGRAGGSDGNDGSCYVGGSSSIPGAGGRTSAICCEHTCSVSASSAGGGRRRKGSCSSSEKPGGGGASGGKIMLLARFIRITGTIEVAGGNGSDGPVAGGGGGAGGNVYLEAAGLQIDPSAFVRVEGGDGGEAESGSSDGVDGADGRLAYKSRSETYPVSVEYMEYLDECTVNADVSTEVDLHYDSEGLHIRNFSNEDKTVLLTMVE